jgi:SHS2 domain-containing protein
VPYEYLEHDADVAIRGIGASLAEAFAEGARGMFGIMANLQTVEPRQSVEVQCDAPDLELLFAEFLNELLFEREMSGLLLSACQIEQLRRGPEGWHLEAVAWGESLDPDRHEILTEVKAATYSGLRVYHQNGQHVVQCLVDV